MIRHLTASAAVIDPRTQTVLLVWHRATCLWMLPGGHIEQGESPAEAALREVAEETGVQAVLVNDHVIDADIYPAPAKPERPGKPAEDAHLHIDLLYAAVGDSRDPITPAEDEVAGVRWEPIADLDSVGARAEVPRVVALAVAEVARWTEARR